MRHRDRDDGRGQITGGLIVLGVGLLFLARNLGWIPGFGTIWPIFPIIVGIALILGGLRNQRADRQKPDRSNSPPASGEAEPPRSREY
jgi:hypothetical protein